MDAHQQKWEEVYERADLPWTNNPVPFDILEKFIGNFKRGDKILDYGGGDGILAKPLMDSGLDVVCSDISAKALALARLKYPSLKTVQASDPSEFIEDGEVYDGLLVWGVMHHIDRNEWVSYMSSFNSILKSNGLLLMGGHSNKDEDFIEGFRISPTTGYVSYAINSLEENMHKSNFIIEDSGYFDFTEGFTGSKRVFKYFFLRKKN